MKVCTIGHSNLELDALIAILTEHSISWVADVRSSPYSRRFPQFNRHPFAAALKTAGIRYLFLGDKIGGKPPEGSTANAWAQGKLNPVLVSRLSKTPRWAEGMAALASTVKAMDREGLTGCILCSEGDANNCHRSLIAFEIEQAIPGLMVQHIKPGSSAANEAHFQKALLSIRDDETPYH